jgi:hypothetical protein
MNEGVSIMTSNVTPTSGQELEGRTAVLALQERDSSDTEAFVVFSVISSVICRTSFSN